MFKAFFIMTYIWNMPYDGKEYIVYGSVQIEVENQEECHKLMTDYLSTSNLEIIKMECK